MAAYLALAARLRRPAVVLGILTLLALAAAGALWPRPGPASANPLTDIAAVSAGSYHTCALTTAGGVRCWGYNGSGRLGDGTTASRTTPIDVSGLTSDVAVVSAGGGHTCAVTTTGGVKCWGDNRRGQLGDGTTTDRTTPVDVSGLTSGVAVIAAGGSHTCALTTASGVKCWGDDYRGQLGDGTSGYGNISTTPVGVSGLTSGVAAVTAGELHTCALTTAGGLKCWGFNYAGRLGDGTETSRSTPVDVSGLTGGVAAVSAGYEHSCAVTALGDAKCWGSNGAGQLGDGTTASERTTPVDVTGLTSGVAAVSAGGAHTCAVTAAGGVQCWGWNDLGQLGEGTTITRRNPVDVSGLTGGVLAVSAGGDHTCAVRADGGVQCWGGNFLGQLGDGTTGGHTSPVDVVGVTKPTPTQTPCPPEGCPTPTSTLAATPTATPCPPEGCPTATPTPTIVPPDFSMAVDTDGDGADDCSTKEGAPAKCSASLGSPFTLKVSLNSLGGLSSYRWFDLYVTYAGVQSKDNIVPVWPDCVFTAPFYAPGEVAFACVVGIGAAPSTYTGFIMTNDFNCTAGESAGNTITLHHGASDTSVQGYHEGEGATESLTIHCVEPTPTHTPSPTPTPLSPQATPPSVGGSGVFPDVPGTGGPSITGYGMVAGVLAAVTAVAIALGGAAWYARRRRLRNCTAD